jgi:glutathione transport system ATP-binding protein
LTVEFASRDGMVRAVSGLDLTIRPGRTLAIVGESGSGKSVTAQAILRLTDHSNGRITAGSMRFQSRERGEIELASAAEDTLRAIRGNEIAMIFQEPMTSLNPVFTIGRQIAETIILHRRVSRGDAG